MRQCKCGCGQEIFDDSRGRPRTFILGHNKRIKKGLLDRVCLECKNSYPRSGNNRGCKGLCKKCYSKIRWHKIYSENPSLYRETRLKTARKIRARIIEEFGGKCECCGETKVEFLSLDHVFGGGSKHASKRTCYGVWRDALKDPDKKNKYRLLCYNCNFSRGKYGYCPHHPNKKYFERIKSNDCEQKIDS